MVWKCSCSIIEPKTIDRRKRVDIGDVPAVTQNVGWWLVVYSSPDTYRYYIRESLRQFDLPMTVEILWQLDCSNGPW
jgi:hypothetical protein